MVAQELAERDLQIKFVLQCLRHLREEQGVKAHLKESGRGIGGLNPHAGEVCKYFRHHA